MINILKLAIIIQAFWVLYPLYYGWEGAIIRSVISATFILTLGFFYFVRGAIKGQLTLPRVRIIPLLGWLVSICLAGSIVGFLHGYPTRAILSDLFPIIEFVASLLLGLVLIKTIEQAKRLIMLFVMSIGLVAWMEVAIYLVYPEFYFHQVLIGGLVIKRVADFTTPIALLLFLAMIGRKPYGTKIFYILGIGMTIAIFLSFLKSIWLASLIGIAIVFAVHPQKQSFVKKIISLVSFIVVGLLIAKIVFSFLKQSQGLITISNASSLTFKLIAQLFDPNLPSFERLQYVSFALRQWAESPIIGKGLGAGWWTSIGETRLAEQLPSQRWRNDIPSYPLFVAWKLGLLGLLIFSIIGRFLIRSLIVGITTLRDPFWRDFLAGICGGYTYVFLISSFAFLPFNHFPIPFYMGIMSAIICKLSWFRPSEQNQISPYSAEVSEE